MMPDRCNVPRCDHPEDEQLKVCESCRQKTCAEHATSYQVYVLCKWCEGLKHTAEARFFSNLTSLPGLQRRRQQQGLAGHEPGQLAEMVRGWADELERWDAEIPKTMTEQII